MRFIDGNNFLDFFLTVILHFEENARICREGPLSRQVATKAASLATQSETGSSLSNIEKVSPTAWLQWKGSHKQ